ncbi:Uncharacterised protein [Mycobacterium tuberculosis]|nr:Uncharacterised protein [Mycobacterium tuberculosis]
MISARKVSACAIVTRPCGDAKAAFSVSVFSNHSSTMPSMGSSG